MKRSRHHREPAAVAVAVAAPVATGYLDNPARIALIFGSFFVLCLPLVVSLLGLTANASAAGWLVAAQAYSILVGYTHFAITFSIYLNSRTSNISDHRPGTSSSISLARS